MSLELRQKVQVKKIVEDKTEENDEDKKKDEKEEWMKKERNQEQGEEEQTRRMVCRQSFDYIHVTSWLWVPGRRERCCILSCTEAALYVALS